MARRPLEDADDLERAFDAGPRGLPVAARGLNRLHDARCPVCKFPSRRLIRG